MHPVVGAVKNDLRCYQCNVSDNIACTEEYLMQCPDKQAYDRCETRVRKAGEISGYALSLFHVQ